ncbi:MAG TPA: hypothetical protein VG389_23945 [Myxococcota bacterium]|nr:hypothetical protein [Myxococcota bacterium]
MSHQAVQRVVVRMLYDADFAAAVYARPAAALAGVALTPEEQAWLVRPDPRAFRTDPYRRARALTGLLEEYPASSALLVRLEGSGGTARLDAFFGSAHFHAAIQERGSLAAAFGSYLMEVAADVAGSSGVPPDPRLAAVAALESAVAAVRRAPARAAPAAPEHGRLRLGAHAAILALPGGTLALFEAVTARLRAHGAGAVAALLDPACRLPAPLAPADPADPAAADAAETLLVERGPAGEVTVEHCPEALATLLSAAREPVAAGALVEEARRLGADPGAEAALVTSLVAGGLLVPA